jgi:diguanylate cyclase (GGDEF)-like protein
MTMRRFRTIWEGLVEPAWMGDARDRHLGRTLNVILLLLLLWGLVFEIQYRLSHEPLDRGEILILTMIGMLALAYYLNRRRYLVAATVLTLAWFVAATFALAWSQLWNRSTDSPVLYYLIVPILMSELFFSMRGYLTSVTMILVGVLGLSLLHPAAVATLLFLFVFCMLIGFSSYHRRLSDEQQLSLTRKIEHEQRKSAQLSLLAEVGRLVTDSQDEQEILESTLGAIVKHNGYAEAAISLLVAEDTLEVAAISGASDVDYRKKLERGIIGHVAKTRQAYLTGDVSHDPYYFSSAPGEGSAIGVPMLDKEHLLGVIYVESVRKNELNQDDLQTLQTLANQVATSIQKARLQSRTQEHLQVLTTLQSISRAVTSSLDLDEILHNVIQLLKDSFGYTYLGIYVLEGDILHLGAQLGYPEDMLIPEIAITRGVVGRTARTKETQLIRDVEADSEFLRGSYEVKSEVAVPLLKEGQVLGVLNVESNRHRPLDENDVNLLNALAGSVAIAIDNARLHAEVKEMAMTDVISGLANRRAFDEILEAEITRATRYHQPLSLIILDLDSFKEYNDRWGHPAGDVRLREVADLLRLNVRDPDVAARYGGEEFAVILPNTTKSGAIRLAERLRLSAAKSAPQKNGNNFVPGYTLSLGVATLPDDAISLEELLLMADNAELTAKRLGKNQVSAANASDIIQNL